MSNLNGFTDIEEVRLRTTSVSFRMDLSATLQLLLELLLKTQLHQLKNSSKSIQMISSVLLSPQIRELLQLVRTVLNQSPTSGMV